jgi:hypothetical protein
MATDPLSEQGNAPTSGVVEQTTTERDESIFNMSLLGMSERAIAAEVGLAKTSVHNIIRRMHDLYVPERYSDMTHNLAHELAILDVLTRGNLAAAAAGSKSAADICLDAHIRRCKLLGLENASKVEVTLKSAQDVEIERLMTLMMTASTEEAMR